VLLKDPAIDLIACATPVSTHFALGMAALESGKHLLLEKPMAASSRESALLLAAARSRGLQIFVDHTFVFTPALTKMKSLVAQGDLGKLFYYDSTRINLGLFQHDVDVIWDLLPHDLAILDFLLDGRLPVSVSCHAASHYNHLADQAYVSLSYDDEFIAHVHVNWVAPVKVRQVLLCGDRKMIVYDETTPREKVRVYDRGVKVQNSEDVYNRMVQYREGDMWAPRLDNAEALAVEIENIAGTLRGTAAPLVPGDAGHRVVTLLEAATTSREHHGRPVMVDPRSGSISLITRRADATAV
jgi:predicted dehydrogenase